MKKTHLYQANIWVGSEQTITPALPPPLILLPGSVSVGYTQKIRCATLLGKEIEHFIFCMWVVRNICGVIVIVLEIYCNLWKLRPWKISGGHTPSSVMSSFNSEAMQCLQSIKPQIETLAKKELGKCWHFSSWKSEEGLGSENQSKYMYNFEIIQNMSKKRICAASFRLTGSKYTRFAFWQYTGCFFTLGLPLKGQSTKKLI